MYPLSIYPEREDFDCCAMDGVMDGIQQFAEAGGHIAMGNAVGGNGMDIEEIMPSPSCREMPPLKDAFK